jgi:hypothetical protein
MEPQTKTYPDLIVTLGNQAKESYPESGLTRRVDVFTPCREDYIS